jgi:hypothetical protein
VKIQPSINDLFGLKRKIKLPTSQVLAAMARGQYLTELPFGVLIDLLKGLKLMVNQKFGTSGMIKRIDY